MKTKGHIDFSAAPDHEKFNRIKELIERCKRDALNVGNEEFDAIMNIVSQLEENYEKMLKSHTLWTTVKPSLTAKQNMKLIEEYLE